MSDPVDTTDPGSDGIPQHAAPEEPGSVATPEDAPRPEPVLDAARLGGLVAAVVVAIAATISLVLAGRWTDVNALGLTLGGLFGAVIALTSYLAPVWQARKARAKVTPLADPRDISGRKLILSEET